MRRGARASKTMRTELEQERRMATNDRFVDAAGEISRRMEDMSRRRKREQKAWEENNNGQEK